MYKLLFLIGFLFMYSSLSAQRIDMKTLERRANLGHDSYSDRALSLAEQYKPNEKGELEITEVIALPGKKKEDMFKNIRDWIISISSDAKSSIVYENSDEGKIITRCYFGKIARRTMGDNRYWVSIRPMITIEFKEERLRLRFNLQNYEVLKRNDDSGYGLMVGGFMFTGDGVTKENQNWIISDCYPYAKSSKHPKVTASKGFVHSIECYKIMKDQIIMEAGKDVKADDNW